MNSNKLGLRKKQRLKRKELKLNKKLRGLHLRRLPEKQQKPKQLE